MHKKKRIISLKDKAGVHQTTIKEKQKKNVRKTTENNKQKKIKASIWS